jgi:hypothetical protein
MQHAQDLDVALACSVEDDVVPDRPTLRTFPEFRSLASEARGVRKFSAVVEELRSDTLGGFEVVLADEEQDLVQVRRRRSSERELLNHSFLVYLLDSLAIKPGLELGEYLLAVEQFAAVCRFDASANLLAKHIELLTLVVLSVHQEAQTLTHNLGGGVVASAPEVLLDELLLFGRE